MDAALIKGQGIPVPKAPACPDWCTDTTPTQAVMCPGWCVEQRVAYHTHESKARRVDLNDGESVLVQIARSDDRTPTGQRVPGDPYLTVTVRIPGEHPEGMFLTPTQVPQFVNALFDTVNLVLPPGEQLCLLPPGVGYVQDEWPR